MTTVTMENKRAFLKHHDSLGKLADPYPEFAITEMKFWISQQPSVPELPDEVIDIFLHACEYSLAGTKNTIRQFYLQRLKNPEFFLNRYESLNIAASQNFFVKLSKPTKESYRIFIAGLFNINADEYDFVSGVKFLISSLELYCFKEALCPGIIVIIDFMNFTFTHSKKADLGTLRTFFAYLQNALAARLKNLILINLPLAAEIFLNLIWPFLPKNIVELTVKCGKNSTKYLDYVCTDILPIEYGGKGESITQLQDNMLKKIKENQTWFDAEEAILQSLLDEKQRT